MTVMVRLRYGLSDRSWGLLLAAAAALVGPALPRASALEQAFRSQSTLDSHVSPHGSNLDATISSMIRRGVIAELHVVPTPSTAKPPVAEPPAGPKLFPAAPTPSLAAPSTTSGSTKWRAAGQDVADITPTPETEPEATPQFPTPPHTPAPVDDADAMAPIDELSETPAPATDAPGDPIEPEFTGPAIADARVPGAKPLSSAPKIGDAALTPLGEPDRIAKPDLTAPPASPENYQEADETPAVAAPTSLPPLTRNQRALRDKVRNVLKHYYNRPLSTVDRSPWEVMHAMLSYEVHSRVLQANRQPITAVGWLCFNQPCENRSLMYLNEDGAMRVKVGPALQGHHGQLLALLAQARVRSDYPMKVEGKDFTVNDLIEMEKATCYPKTELTFKLIGLQRYLDIDARWVNEQGMAWDFPTLVREEMRQPVRTAACGGTHRLGGLALAVKKRRASGLPVDGVYAEAEKFVANYQNYAYSLQNPDGSFSTWDPLESTCRHASLSIL